MRRFAVWAVYGTVNGKVGVRVAEHRYNRKADAEEQAKSLPNGYVVREIVEKVS